MIGAVLGFAVTYVSAHAGSALAKHWRLGPLGTIAVGWTLGMAFALAVVAAGILPSRSA